MLIHGRPLEFRRRRAHLRGPRAGTIRACRDYNEGVLKRARKPSELSRIAISHSIASALLHVDRMDLAVKPESERGADGLIAINNMRMKAGNIPKDVVIAPVVRMSLVLSSNCHER